MDSHQFWTERHDRANSAGNRVGDIVEFEIQKNRHPGFRDRFKALGTVGHEKLQAKLKTTHMSNKSFGKANRLIDIRCVDSTVNPFIWSHLKGPLRYYLSVSGITQTGAIG